MRRVLTYVEADVGMALDHTTVAWVFDLDLWGRCGQGVDEPTALAALAAEINEPIRPEVVERITGDEQAFRRDEQPATDAERATTVAIHAAVRRETIGLLAGCSPEVLDFDDPARVLPTFAKWRTLRQMAWHLADTESRYYLPGVGLPARKREADLMAELTGSARHVQEAVWSVPADLICRADGEIWTTTKLLRRLAWHERSELTTMRRLATRARQSLEARRRRGG